MVKNFYQSKLRRDINELIYKKPVFEIDFLGEKYFGTVKQKGKYGINLNWYQVMGIYIGDITGNTGKLLNEFEKIKKSFGKGFGDIFFQFGFVDLLDKFDIRALEQEDTENVVRDKRLEKEYILKNTFGFLPSFRENMPLATVCFNLAKSPEELRKDISKSARNHINKAKTRGLEFETVRYDSDWDKFYEIWLQTAQVKGFNIISKKLFFDLRDYVLSNKCGNLFLAKKEGEIVSGSFCFFHNDEIIYMYGATNRIFGNVGGHQFLKYEMFKWGGDNSFKYADLLGVAPTGFKGHHLDGVTSFKQSLGGSKIEYLGNYDMVFNRLLYKIFKMSKKS